MTVFQGVDFSPNLCVENLGTTKKSEWLADECFFSDDCWWEGVMFQLYYCSAVLQNMLCDY